MKALATLALLFTLGASAQPIVIGFTRAELEAAADSALKGQDAVRAKVELTKAIDQYTTALETYLDGASAADSLMKTQRGIIAALNAADAVNEAEIERLTEQNRKRKGWAIVGKVGTGTVAVLGVLGLFFTVKSFTE